MDNNKLIKTYFCEDLFSEKEIFENKEAREQILKNILNYFNEIRENAYINFGEEESIKYFVDNKVDLLYEKIYRKL